MFIQRLIFTPFQFLRTNFLLLSTAVVLLYGWSLRDDNYLSAEDGAGYVLGIVGGSLMLVLLLYPVSKRVAVMTRIVPARFWFGVHMLLGTIGPAMILFHSNFHLGSANSSIALISMLLVAGSGIIGRYIYTHIHHGLYGTRITIKELKQETEKNHSELLSLYAMDEKLNKQLIKMETTALQPYPGLAQSFLQVIYLAVNAPRLKRKILRLLKNSPHENSDNKTLPKKDYTHALRKTAAFRLYERLFSLWHILHLPLFIMMIITAIIHIFAVHLY
jgi:hypothetical protein